MRRKDSRDFGARMEEGGGDITEERGGKTRRKTVAVGQQFRQQTRFVEGAKTCFKESLQMAHSFFKILLDPSAPHLSLPPDFVSMHLENKIPNDPIIRTAYGRYSWRLEIKKIDDAYCFTNGWNNVVKDIKLGFADFLVFLLVDQSTFEMSIYSPDGERSMMLKNIDGKEWVTSVKLDKSYRASIRYYVSYGWSAFRKQNGLSQGDECVFKFIKREGKLLLAKVIKNKWPVDR
ncbi:hypothetical protein E3N88_19831 [Mikania micrantha]|uniref:TF-B3 domain-containing protein n=1 Tax=Mikania micrantha TaxID=192012 RepID=A0A5N6NRQ4_9ASTR|nr:hypothetical protein E3N88_19831 [Mikania micrantha]